MNPLKRLAACAGKTMARIEMLLPGIFDDALESDYEAALVEAEAESEVHEPPRTVDSLGIDERDAVWKSTVGALWKWGGQRWWYTVGGEWTAAPYDYWPRASGPFTAVDPPAMDWHGWAVPAVLECLAEHKWMPVDRECKAGCGKMESFAWREHVAPLIAARIGCDPQRAIEALSHYKPDRISQ